MLRGTVSALVILTLSILFGATPASSADQATTQLQRLKETPLPPRNLDALAARFLGTRGYAPSPPADAEAWQMGYAHSFWILDQGTNRMLRINAQLRHVTAHAYWLVQDELVGGVSLEDLARSAQVFEDRTLPTVQRYFGPLPASSPSGDPRLVILLARVPSVAAYFSGADTFPASANPHSNEHNILYFSLDTLRPGGGAFDGVMAHELQHMVQFARCPYQETWFDEGSSELATAVDGYPVRKNVEFSAAPNIQLTAWSNQSADITRHYEAAYLFLQYAAGRFGGWDALPSLYSGCARGARQLDFLLRSQPISPDFENLFADWTVANVVNDPTVADGRFSYLTGGVQVTGSTPIPPGGSLDVTLPQYSASYLELPAASSRATFLGSTSVPLTSASAGAQMGVWWSNRADNLDSTLTRSLDLTSSRAPILATFRTWFDMERGFDFAYLSASTDNGSTWTPLPGRHTAPDDAVGNGYGEGWTGASGLGSSPEWIDESVDLSSFVGYRILLRFEYVTDQGYNAEGFAFDSFQVDALGIDDTRDGGSAWTSNGWIRVDGPIPQTWELSLVTWPNGGGASVRKLVPSIAGSTSFEIPSALRNVLVVAPTAARTLVPAHFSVGPAA